MNKFAVSIAGLALSAAPALAQYPMMPAPYPYGVPARPMMWVAPQPMVYYMPQPYVQVVPVPVAKVQAAGVMTSEGIYPMEGYRPQVPARPATAPTQTAKASAVAATKLPAQSTGAAAPSGVQPVGSWSSAIMPWGRRDHATKTAISGSVNTSVRQDLGPASK
ncbi:MAG: hypothetical protein K2X38_02355 [Gemmataceae bacterium]|nr:hypothetical protein [Gemmataceae bacterium]